MTYRISDKIKKQIIADYVESGNYSAVARKHGISKDTVRRFVQKHEDVTKIAEEKKEQNAKDMLEYMDSKKQDAMKFIDLALAEMMDPDKLKRTGVQALATSLGIVVDKFTPTTQNDKSLEKLDEVLEKIGGVI